LSTRGIPSVLVGIASYFVLPDGPDHAYFLTEEEKQMMRLRKSREVGQSEDAQKFHWKDVRAAAFDWKVWALYVAFKSRLFGVLTSRQRSRAIWREYDREFHNFAQLVPLG
jgi:hypothetical protein